MSDEIKTMLAVLSIVVIMAIWVGYFIWMKVRMNQGIDVRHGNRNKWVMTTGFFTGVIHEHSTRFGKGGTRVVNIPECEVKYDVNGELRSGWYQFYPLEVPEGIQSGLAVEVRYSAKKPWRFELHKICWPEGEE